ncbi:lysine biosynthesis protein LysW [Candidatus Bathyarchaeota archaeon]|nr:lysine biosynthesis protein LysW [Candidatus Bathyarchaeota archaeon]MBL7080343.1 lysine biosynthesis protein LysW [Candidatus Bathyarchaeota archaeon]
MMSNACMDCGANLDVPNDSLQGEIIGCPDCGLDFVIEMDESGNKQLRELLIEGEDWGE